MANVLTVPNSGIISFDSRAYSDLTVPPLSTSARISYDGGGGVNITSYATATTALDRFSVDGTQGRLFSVTDSLTGTLFSVNNITGLPILEVQDSDTVIAGKFNTNALVVSGTSTGLGTLPLGTNRLSVSGDSTFVGSISATSTLFLNTVQIRTRPTANVFIGDSTTGRDATTGNHNFVFGLSAGTALTFGGYNVFIGNRAGRVNSSGGCNNFLGRNAGDFNTTGGSNNFLGYRAGFSNTYGGSNNFFGRSAGANNTSGSFNNFFGRFAGSTSTTGGNNNFFGLYAGYRNSLGGFNNFLGYRAGECNTTGFFNNSLGIQAGCFNTTGSNNIFIGNNANTASAQVSALNSVIVLGTGAVATESHQVVLSTANVIFRNIGNTFQIGSSAVPNNLTVFGNISSDNLSVAKQAQFTTVDELQTVANISLSTLNLVLTSSSFFVVNFNSNITSISLLNPPGNQRAYSFVLQLSAPNAPYFVTWPTSIRWPSGTAPTLTSGVSSVDTFTFITYNGGINYFGFVSGLNS